MDLFHSIAYLGWLTVVVLIKPMCDVLPGPSGSVLANSESSPNMHHPVPPYLLTIATTVIFMPF